MNFLLLALSLWYTQPATSWSSQSLPVGNGRVGGTVFGGEKTDVVNLNEVSLWTGGPNLPGNGSGYSYGPKSGVNEFGSYQPFGQLVADYDLKGDASDYRRSLDIETALARTEFRADGTRHTREVFASRPDDVLVYAAKTEKPAALNVKFSLTPYHDVAYSVTKDTIIMRGTLANGEIFEGRLFVRTKGGKVAVTGGEKNLAVGYEGKGDGMRPTFEKDGIPAIEITGADMAEAYVTLATNYKEDYKAGWKGEDPAKFNESVLANVRAKKLGAIRAAHIADHAALFNRLSIDLGKTDFEISKLPTNERICKYRETKRDPELEALIYQYGRYMLIAGSRPGNLPLTLQGIWNDKVHAAWACDYHNNINIQMCYWGAEVANLSECHMPFIDFMTVMEEPLHEMTVKNFGADKKGWTTRISQNIWGAGGWVMWNPPVNAWYALHVWDHYQFTLDKAFLAKTGYPIMKSICEFWETTLKEGADGKLVSPKGWSHEWGPTEDAISHDQQLVWELFDNTVCAAKILKTDEPWAKKIKDLKNRLELPKVSPTGGYLQEWHEDRPNMVSGHRHTSHLIGIYPGTMLFNQPNSDKLVPAAVKSLELRGTTGDCRRSWTWPWRTALWARLHNTNQAYEMVQGYICHNLLDNLFGNHPPMQMDGTYGMTGGMSEIFVQSQKPGEVELLPALPPAWKDGSIKGIRARGNLTIDMTWKGGKLDKDSLSITTTTPNPKPITIVYRGKKAKVTPKMIKLSKK